MNINMRKTKQADYQSDDGKILLYEALTGDSNKDPEYVMEITQKIPWWGWVLFGIGVLTIFYVFINY